MAGLIPFNYRRNELSNRNLMNMIDDFFNEAWPIGRDLMNDSFKIDVQESDTAYTVKAEVPGVRKEDINLSLDDGRLTINVDQCEDIQKDDEKYIHRERRCSSMQRAIYLAGAGDGQVDAQLNDGILKIVVPKKEQVKNSKKIEIK